MLITFGRAPAKASQSLGPPQVLKPEDYKDFEAFFTDLSSVWDSTWKEVNSASTAGATF